ncbi:MAG TPA: hypothetical protein VL358_06530 [Caulobacteraceae bacterium]|jgi:hypothetical protein|nr:hypothetical protein [Caulobacteraceae bacterium]
MVEFDHSDTKRVVQELNQDSYEYARRFVLWLGVGSGGGAVAILSFSAQLPNPDYALRALLPSLAMFSVGVMTAAGSMMAASRRQAAGAEHFASAFNRGQLGEALRKTPEWFASAQRVADEMNTGRNRVIEKHDREHADAENAWKRRARWDRVFQVCVAVSSLAFVGGISWPLGLIELGHSLVDAPAASARLENHSLPTKARP